MNGTHPRLPCSRGEGKGTLLADGPSASTPPSPGPGRTPTSHSASLCTQERHAVLIQTEGNKKYGGKDRHGNVNLLKDLPTMNTILNSQSSKWLSMGGRKLSFHTTAVLILHVGPRQKPRAPHPSRSCFTRSGAGGQPACGPNTSWGGCTADLHPTRGPPGPTTPPVFREEPWARANTAEMVQIIKDSTLRNAPNARL